LDGNIEYLPKVERWRLGAPLPAAALEAVRSAVGLKAGAGVLEG